MSYSPFCVPAKVTKLVSLKNGGHVSPTNLITFAVTQNGDIQLFGKVVNHEIFRIIFPQFWQIIFNFNNAIGISLKIFLDHFTFPIINEIYLKFRGVIVAI
jgi:hypothetical protein